jgi:hypothetical protein
VPHALVLLINSFEEMSDLLYAIFIVSFLGIQHLLLQTRRCLTPEVNEPLFISGKSISSGLSGSLTE